MICIRLLLILAGIGMILAGIGMLINDKKISMLMYADDIVLMAESEND